MDIIINFLNDHAGKICIVLLFVSIWIAYAEDRKKSGKKAKQAELDAINESLNDPVKTFRTESEYELKIRKRQLEKELNK